MRDWTARQWLVAALVAAGIVLVAGAVTGLIPNPLFTRMIEAPWWSYPVWIASAVLSGLLVASYLAPSAQLAAERSRDQRRTVVGAVLSFLAVGCPTCNKLVVLALGTSGAVTWFGPLQPVLAIGSLVLLGFALRARLRSARGCRVPAAGRP
ncbi:hypothetical protein [Saccharopolyspora oryzae]|uniref:Integral membrane protein n=1 Tax=Saccharopolyspora oryzae TaxID=2997343 RepID=A0ABT4UU52_9PSEU|nr:hypothetical protein [Saccharopolyspora oryzae]MDA3625252.1 hypothetical protein [Saccharopolyspora oryzae]